MSETASTVEAPTGGFHRELTSEASGSATALPWCSSAPALVLLGVGVVYPNDQHGHPELLRPERRRVRRARELREAVQRRDAAHRDQEKLLWLVVVPAFVTAIGLSSRSCSSAYGSRWRSRRPFHADGDLVLRRRRDLAVHVRKGPSQGTINAAIAVVKDVVQLSGALSAARPSTEALVGGPEGGSRWRSSLEPGSVAQLGLTAIRCLGRSRGRGASGRPGKRSGGDHRRGVEFQARWRYAGEVEEGELGLPGVTVELRDEGGGGVVASTETEANGTFAFEEVEVRVRRCGDRVADVLRAFAGVSWLGLELITPIDHDGVHLGMGRVRDGRIAAGLAAISARPARGGADRRRNGVDVSGASRSRCSPRSSRSCSSRWRSTS